MARYTIWAGKPLADIPAAAGRPAATGRHAQTFCRRVTGTRQDAMRVAVTIPDDPNHSLVHVTVYVKWDKLTREHVTKRVARRDNGVWTVGAEQVAAVEEARKQARLAGVQLTPLQANQAPSRVSAN